MYHASVFICLFASSRVATAFVPQQQWSIGASGQTVASLEDAPLSSAFVQGGQDPNTAASPDTWDTAKIIATAAEAAAEEEAKAAAEKKSASPSPDVQTVSSGLGGSSSKSSGASGENSVSPASSQSPVNYNIADAPPAVSPTFSSAAGQAAVPTKESTGTGAGRSCFLQLPQDSSGPGNCPMVLSEGQKCQPQCATGYAISAASSVMECRDGVLRKAECQELSNHQTEYQQPQMNQPVQVQATNVQQQEPNKASQVNQPQDQQEETTAEMNTTAEAVSSQPVETLAPVPLGHIIAVLSGALVLIMAPAIYVKTQGAKKKDADADAEDGGNAGAEEGIASEKRSQAGSKSSKVPLAEAAM